MADIQPAPQLQDADPDPDRAPAHALAWAHPVAYIVFLVPVLALLPLDLFTKYWSFQRFHERPTDEASLTVIPNLLEFRTVLNQGALFGIGHGWQWFFIVASVLACAFVAYLFATSGRRQWWIHVALALVLSGALGNLYDRATVQLGTVTLKSGEQRLGLATLDDDRRAVTLADYPRRERQQRLPIDQIVPDSEGRLIVRTSAVRDFIHIHWTFSGKAPWPWIFNLADVYLCVGVAILVLNWLVESWRARRERRAQRAESDEDEAPYFGSIAD